MTDLSTLRSLQKRIRDATGADRELDWLIENTFGKLPLGHAPHYTTDPDGLGACVALLHATLPGCLWSKDADGYFWIRVDRGTIYSRRIEGEKLANDCLTFLDAICATKIAEIEAADV